MNCRRIGRYYSLVPDAEDGTNQTKKSVSPRIIGAFR